MSAYSSSIIPASASRSGYAIRLQRKSATLGALGAVMRFVDSGLEHLVDVLFTWQRRLADRRALESLDDRMLRDIGVTRADVFLEASKPFWKP